MFLGVLGGDQGIKVENNFDSKDFVYFGLLSDFLKSKKSFLNTLFYIFRFCHTVSLFVLF